MNGRGIFAVPPTWAISADLSGWIDGIAPRIIQRAARHAPQALSERLEEEWLAHLAERRGRISRLRFACGCCWAAAVIGPDDCTVKVPSSSSPATGTMMTAHSRHGPSLFSRRTIGASTSGTVMCDINTTPLIDVMLVMLVTLIISLPLMTHAIKLDLPRTLPRPDAPPPEIINLDIDFDGTVVWNGTAIASAQQLENYFHAEAQKNPQPEIHLRPDRRVKYDFVAKVLALAQRNRLNKIGFVDTAEFQE
jgi:biopolymer transport protein ExbD